MSVIAILGGSYCAAEQIAKRVAERLEYEYVGAELLDRAAESHDTTAAKLARAMAGERALFNAVTHEWEKSLIYIKSALADELGRDNIVYLGHATHLIPPAIGHVMKVGLIADAEFRIAWAKEQEGLGEAEAKLRMQRADEQLTQWTAELRGVSPWDASLYDLKIPVHTISVDGAIDLICENVAKETLRITDRSIQATIDFRMAAQINLRLLDEGYYYCDVAVDAGNVTVVVNKPPQKGALARAMYGLRLDSLEEELQQLCQDVEGIETFEIRPGAKFAPAPRALLVDDEQDYVVTLSERLGMRELDTNVVYDGQQALSSIDAEEPDVMVLDLRMPGIDGIEVLRRTKRDHPNIEVIVVTGHGSEKDERLARELGAFDYLQKPVEIDHLAERMKAASEKARQNADGQAPASEDSKP